MNVLHFSILTSRSIESQRSCISELCEPHIEGIRSNMPVRPPSTQAVLRSRQGCWAGERNGNRLAGRATRSTSVALRLSQTGLRLTAVVLPVLLASLVGVPGVSAEELSTPAFGLAGISYDLYERPRPGDARGVVLAPGSSVSVPIVASSIGDGGVLLATSIYVSNHSDSQIAATLRFRDDAGADLTMPVSSDPANAVSAPVDLKAVQDLQIGANDTGQVVVMPGTPDSTGWAEVETVPAAAVSVVAMRVWSTAGSSPTYAEVPSTPQYRRAWLVVDGTVGHTSDLVLVNSGSEESLSVHLSFRSGDVSCDSTVVTPAKGRSVVQVSTALPCSAALLGTVEINADSPFTGLAEVGLPGQGERFVRSLTGLPDVEPVPLAGWTVSAGNVRFEHLGSTACIDLQSRMLVGVDYAVRTSGWQWRADSSSDWVDLPDTERARQICANDPSEPGEYRGVAEISVDGVPGLHASSNSITVPVPALSVGAVPTIPSFVAGDETVRFGSLAGACVGSAEGIRVDWVLYEIRSSRWQTRQTASSEWTDVEGTASTGQICAFSPESPGEYRAVANVARNGVAGTYASSNILTVQPPAPPPGTAGQPGAEECSQLVGCFIPLPAGSFQMGSESDEAEADEAPLTNVTISEGVQIGKYEVTHSQWELIMGRSAAYVESDCEDSCPIVAVAFLGINDIKVPRFLDLLNSRDPDFQYRLPTEAEWEYAARAGSTADRYGAVDDVAWHSGNSSGEIQQIGQKAPNAWGFYDMLGNVYEWVQDFYAPYPGGSVTDPIGPSSGSRRIVRGGSYMRSPSDARASNRQAYSPGQLAPHIGLRLARVRK